MKWPQLPSDPHQAALLATSAVLIAGASLVIASRHLWRLLPAPSVDGRSTTSSTGGGAAAYETTKAVDEYLQFHYAPADQLLPYTDAPKDFTGELGAPTALDVGCAVGGATFELARVFPLVVGLDYSQHFVDAACAMQAAGRMPYTAVVEGDVTETCEAVVDDAIDRSRVRFVRGDACNLPKQMRPVDCVLAANLLCRLPQPERFLADLPRLLKPGGIAVLVSPYSWLAAWTPRQRWLGGYYDGSKAPVSSFETLRGIMERQGFKLVAQEDMPFLIREHVRKYQWGCSHATVWRRCS